MIETELDLSFLIICKVFFFPFYVCAFSHFTSFYCFYYCRKLLIVSRVFFLLFFCWKRTISMGAENITSLFSWAIHDEKKMKRKWKWKENSGKIKSRKTPKVNSIFNTFRHFLDLNDGKWKTGDNFYTFKSVYYILWGWRAKLSFLWLLFLWPWKAFQTFI